MKKSPGRSPKTFSKSVLALNSEILDATGRLKTTVEQPWNDRQPASEPKKAQCTTKPLSDGPTPNKTELRFRDWWEIFHAMLGRLRFQPITLRIGKRRYTPDWVYFGGDYIRILEVKGPWIEDDAKLKYDLFKTHFEKETHYGMRFEMWQEKDGIWTNIR